MGKMTKHQAKKKIQTKDKTMHLNPKSKGRIKPKGKRSYHQNSNPEWSIDWNPDQENLNRLQTRLCNRAIQEQINTTLGLKPISFCNTNLYTRHIILQYTICTHTLPHPYNLEEDEQVSLSWHIYMWLIST